MLRYTNRLQYFCEQDYTARKYILPFVGVIPKSVLEIGCGEGGNLKPFLDVGCKVTGIDLAWKKIYNAKLFFKDHPYRYNLTLIQDNVFDLILPTFDLIIIKDTIEHISNKATLFTYLKQLLKPTGKVFISFPPWSMPYAGHQQMCTKRIMRLPFIHLLPFYERLLRTFENESKTADLLSIKESRLSVRQFKSLIKNFKIDKEIRYLTNPSYEIKYRLPVIRAFVPLDIMTTSYYCLLSKV
jgi:2-polyprenyl-3-methyl-5-hydroxy-6-metoxy-1,4-benzoquinol methylase